MSKTLSLVLLSLVIATGCTQSPAGDKAGGLESQIANEAITDGDSAADSYSRHVAIQGEIGFGDTVEGHYASGGYAGWVLTATAGARLAIDASATDGSDTVLALYGPMTGANWNGNRPIEVNDDFHGSTNSHIDHRVTRAGTYLVIVREYYGHAGNFDLTLACSGTECRQECAADNTCPTGSECNRVVCIRAPCPSYCHPVVAHHEGDSCEASLCGVAPRIATLQCDDGSVGGFTGNCLYNADGATCHWEIRSCPPAACAPNTRLCVQGSHYDGTPGVCACVPDSTVCGGFRGAQCPDGQFCNFPSTAMCGYADQSGTCAPRPQVCPAIYMPVCGCDGVTYSNYCHANGAGVSILHTGACS